MSIRRFKQLFMILILVGLIVVASLFAYKTFVIDHKNAPTAKEIKIAKELEKSIEKSNSKEGKAYLAIAAVVNVSSEDQYANALSVYEKNFKYINQKENPQICSEYVNLLEKTKNDKLNKVLSDCLSFFKDNKDSIVKVTNEYDYYLRLNRLAQLAGDQETIVSTESKITELAPKDDQ